MFSDVISIIDWFMNWLDEYSSAVTAIATVVLAILT